MSKSKWVSFAIINDFTLFNLIFNKKALFLQLTYEKV